MVKNGDPVCRYPNIALESAGTEAKGQFKGFHRVLGGMCFRSAVSETNWRSKGGESSHRNSLPHRATPASP